MTLVSKLSQPPAPITAVKYPCLMSGPGGSIVLFTKRGEGVIVVQGNYHFVGHWRSDWITDQFTPLPVGSEVTIEVRE